MARRSQIVFVTLAAVALAFALASAAYATPFAAAEESSTVTTPSVDPTATVDPLVSIEDDDLRLVFGGAWRSLWSWNASGLTARTSQSKGASVQGSFEGTGVAVVGVVGPSSGQVDIYIDGVLVGNADFYSATSGARRSVWSTGSLDRGPHTIKVVAAGTKSPASTGYHVTFDAFDVPQPTGSEVVPGTFTGSSKLARTGKWYLSERTGPYGGSSWRTATKGSTYIVRFKGTAVTWVGRRDKGSGKTEILLDGKRIATVSQYATSSAEKRAIYAVSGLNDGVHVLTLRSLGSPSVSGGGVKSDVDGFAVKGTLLQAYPPTPFSYPWKTYIVVDKSSFSLYWVKDKMLIKVYPIAHGRPYWPTPSRVWRIDSKYRTAPSSVYGPRKMRLYKRVSTSRGYRYEYTRYLIHGTNEPWVIGTQASHGCIRMYNSHVLELWPQVPLGTMVVTRD